ncbi:hypothetical protein [Bdellovibrio sp. HCB337]|uniref:hypothetical protein n=1 Tax=Bdellovibrio sp. HCB337 TaxID=3394358 RepID=UPI0039A5DED7
MEVVELFPEVFVGEKNATFWKFGDKINFETDIVAGFSPTNYHSFIICKDIEFHPQFSFNPTRIIPRRRETIRAGAFVHISGFSKETIDQFYDLLLAQKPNRFPSCHMAVLMLLNEGLGLELDDSRRIRYRPSRMIQAMLDNKGHFEKKNLKARFHLLKDKTPDAFVKGIQYFESKFYYGYWISDFYLAVWNLFHPNPTGTKELLVREQK